MIAQAKLTAKQQIAWAAKRELFRCRAPRVLGHCEFAEKYIRIKTGDNKGPWRRSTLPWAGAFFDLLDDPRWLRVVVTGPTQSGKTQQCLTIPTLRKVKELPQNNIVLGFPDGDMVDKKFRTDFLPMIENSPGLRGLLPSGGVGSKGGKIKDTFTFGNGVVAALMTKGASDEGKAGFTADYAAITEAGGFSEGPETSTETDPLRQIIGRLLAFKRENRRVMIEGTVKVASMLPWTMRGRDDGPMISSQSRLLTPCPHCGEWVCPEREHFVGWQEAETEDMAANEGTFTCPACTAILDDDDRKEANRDLRVVHRGQDIDVQGNVTGPEPPTSTLWFRYTQWHNLLTSYGDLGAKEWEAAQQAEGTAVRDRLERALHQQTWCIPFVSSLVENETLDPEDLVKRTESWPKNILPPDTKRVTIGVDLGKRKGWWVAIAWREGGQRHVPSYGDFEVMPEGEGDVHAHIVSALKDSIRPMVEQGFAIEGAENMVPEAVWIDGGYHPDAVAEFVRDSGGVKCNRYRFCRGRGESASHKWLKGAFYNRKKTTKATPYIGKGWFAELNTKRRCIEVTCDSDHWKLDVDDGFRGDKEGPGKITLYQPTKIREHDQLCQHVANEQYVSTWKAGEGEKGGWKKSGQNHGKDVLAYASGANAALEDKLPGPRPVVIQRRDHQSITMPDVRAFLEV